MTDYSKMSDYEINNRVHNILVCDSLYELTVEGYRVTWKDRKTGEETVTLRKQYDAQLKDYCNSWADAGPIIHINRLYVDPIFISDWCVTTECDTYRVIHKNPLRAAMIVFLMMNEGE